MAKRGQAREMDAEEQAWLDNLVDDTADFEVEGGEEEEHETPPAAETEEQPGEDSGGEDAETGEEVAAEADEGTEKPVKKPDESDPRFKAILAELQEERTKRQEAETKAIKYETYWEMVERQQQEKAEKAEASKEAIPDFDIDPTANLNARLEATEKAAQEAQMSHQQMAQMQALGQAVKQSEMTFVSQHPDYYDALAHVRDVVRKTNAPMMKAKGMTDMQIEQMLAQNELAMAAQLLQVGQDPAQYAYEVAKTYGYQPKENVPESDAGQQGPDEDKLDKMEKGLKMSRGQSGSSKITKQEIDSMSLPEFEAAMAEAFGNTKH